MRASSTSRRAPALLAVMALTAGGLVGAASTAPATALPDERQDAAAPSLIPAPTSMRMLPGEPFRLAPDTSIVLAPSRPEAEEELREVAAELTDVMRPSTGYDLPVVEAGEASTESSIRLQLVASDRLGEEGYRLDVTHGGVRLVAHAPAGLFYGVQTLRQLLPAAVESDTVQDRSWTIPAVHITDSPQFGWRGAMLDVARHFFSVQEVKRYIDLLAQYKINVLHLHLADDQGWRIEIDSWPRLATYGGSTEVGGGPGGYYTKEEFAELVDYAGQHQIMVVPEIDMPGHTNAALASYAELNCDDTAPELYTGISVGFSSLCIGKPITYEFVEDVIRELSAISPSPYIHIGGDEAYATEHEDYVGFIQRVEEIVTAHGKRMIGWEEITGADPAPTSVAQHWWDDAEAQAAADSGMGVILSPAEKVYLDMKYDEDTPLGLSWAGYTSVRDSYSWEPGSWVQGLPDDAVYGVEAPLWSETLENIDDVEFMAFPRLPGVAERGWSEPAGRSWEEYRLRLADHGPRWEQQSVNFYRSRQVPWS